MTRPLALAALGAALAVAASGCATSGASASSSSAASTAATEAADFTVRAVDGTTFTLSEHLGQKVIVLDFWATWCVPCMTAMPHLEALWQEYKDQGLLVVGVSMDGPETVAQVAPMARHHGLTFPVVLDEETRAVSVYNPHRSAPYQVVIGKDGRIATSHEGYNPGDELALEKTVRALLAPATQGGSAGADAPQPAPCADGPAPQPCRETVTEDGSAAP